MKHPLFSLVKAGKNTDSGALILDLVECRIALIPNILYGSHDHDRVAHIHHDRVYTGGCKDG